MISWREGSADVLISASRVSVFAPRTGTSIEAFPGMRNGSWSNGQLRRRSPRSSGLEPFLKTSPSTASSRSRSCAGASSGTTRN